MKNPLKGKFTKKSNISESDLPDFLQQEMLNARLGVLYVFSNTIPNGNYAKLLLGGAFSTVGNSLGSSGKMLDDKGLDIGGKVVSGAETPIKELVGYFEKTAKPPSDNKEKKSLWQKILDFFSGLPKKIMAKLSEKIPDMATWGSAIKTIIKGIVGLIVDAATPLSGAMDVVKGTVQACHAGWNRAASWLDERTTSLVTGVGTAIVGAVQRAMDRSLAEGLWNVAKGGTQIGLTGIAGAGALVKAIASGLELIVAFILRIFEVQKIKEFCKDAKVLWRDRSISKFHHDPVIFSRWFSKYALSVPAIGAVALNCGYCGGPMQYLNMYNGGGKVISQKDFDAGVSMLVRLKRYSAKYLNDTGISFGSHDPVVLGALNAAKDYGKINNIKQNSVSDVMLGILTG